MSSALIILQKSHLVDSGKALSYIVQRGSEDSPESVILIHQEKHAVATWNPSESSWILKEINLPTNSEDWIREVKLLKNNAHALLTLEHPHVIRHLHYQFVERTRLSPPVFQILTENWPGLSLKEWAQERTEISYDFLQTISRQLRSGVEYIHARHILHMSLRGENVRMSVADGKVNLKIGNFEEMAKLDTEIPRTNELRNITSSIPFSSPEMAQFRATGNFVEVGRKTDIFSMGATIIECIQLGQPPRFVDENEEEQRLDGRYYNLVLLYRSGGKMMLPDLGWIEDEQDKDNLRNFLQSCVSNEKKMRSQANDLIHHPFLRHVYAGTS